MTQFSHDDDDQFVNFLKQHRPLPPKANIHLEEQLMELIRREPVSLPKQPSSILWFIFSAIAASLLLILGSYRWFNAAPKMTTTSDQELEAFLIESWDTSIGESTPNFHSTSLDSEWIMMTESQSPTYSYSHP